MQIHCPVCDYTREVDAAKIPSHAEFATCPKCRHHFRFRALDLDSVDKPAAPAKSPQHADIWDAVGSLESRWKAENKTPPEGNGAEEDDRNQETPKKTEAGAPTESRPFNEEKEAFAVPWENPRQLGYIRSFLQTTQWVLFSPASFFSSLTKRPAIKAAIFYYLIFGLIQHTFTLLWFSRFLHLIQDSFTAKFGEDAFSKLMVQANFDFSTYASALFSMPFLLIIQLFLSATIVHILTRLSAPREADFFLAFKVSSYASAAILLTAIPVAGLFLGSMGYFALLVIGCKHAYKLTWGKSLVTVIPLYILAFFLSMMQFSPGS
ncbi:hypothetical protein FACS1894206_02170 [Deltaproteobacteria bacterium]|nr:hypothetical protein FACS1894206_02170 [Deltaproteobacteria bacterium]